MCTAATYKTKDFYFGRTLDYEFSYGDEIVITPRNYPFHFRHEADVNEHYAIIGMAHVSDNYPLYYDAVNEAGLCMAGLNFVGNAHYEEIKENRDNIAQFEFIPWILAKCKNVSEAKSLIERINLVNTQFNEKLPLAQLHWIIADTDECIVVESVKKGIKVYANPSGVLTNNPPFDEQLFALSNYMHLSTKPPKNTFSEKLDLKPYSRGMGALGLPGDVSSQSRFVRAAFVKLNSLSGDGEAESVSQFFHILGSVHQQRGVCEVEEGKYEISTYTSCCNADKGIYYYQSYDRHMITAVDMKREDLSAKELIRYERLEKDEIKVQNL